MINFHDKTFFWRCVARLAHKQLQSKMHGEMMCYNLPSPPFTHVAKSTVAKHICSGVAVNAERHCQIELDAISKPSTTQHVIELALSSSR